MTLPKLSYIHVVDKAFAVKRMAEIINESFSGDATLDALLSQTLVVADKIIAGTSNKHFKNLTVEIEETDLLRDNIIRSLHYLLKSLKYNFKYPEKVDAANRLLINVFGETLSLIYLPLGVESANIEEKIKTLTEKHAEEIELTGIGELIEDLKNANERFNILYSARSKKLGEVPESYSKFDNEINKNLRLLCGYIDLKMDKNSVETIFDPLMRVTKRTISSDPVPE